MAITCERLLQRASLIRGDTMHEDPKNDQTTALCELVKHLANGAWRWFRITLRASRTELMILSLVLLSSVVEIRASSLQGYEAEPRSERGAIAENVIIVVIDGIRFQEATSENMPFTLGGMWVVTDQDSDASVYPDVESLGYQTYITWQDDMTGDRTVEFARLKSAVVADLDGDGFVDTLDLLVLLTAWGPNPDHPADLNGDGVVDTLDLLQLLVHWS